VENKQPHQRLFDYQIILDAGACDKHLPWDPTRCKTDGSSRDPSSTTQDGINAEANSWLVNPWMPLVWAWFGDVSLWRDLATFLNLELPPGAEFFEINSKLLPKVGRLESTCWYNEIRRWICSLLQGLRVVDALHALRTDRLSPYMDGHGQEEAKAIIQWQKMDDDWTLVILAQRRPSSWYSATVPPERKPRNLNNPLSRTCHNIITVFSFWVHGSYIYPRTYQLSG